MVPQVPLGRVRGRGASPPHWGGGGLEASSGNFLKSKIVISAFFCDFKQHFGGGGLWVLEHFAKKMNKCTTPVELGLQVTSGDSKKIQCKYYDKRSELLISADLLY